MITWFLDFIDNQVARNNSTRELEGGKWVGIFVNSLLFSQYWMGVWTGHDFVSFGQSEITWYVKVLGSLMYLVIGFLTAFAYGMSTTHLAAVLFGNLTVKRRRAWGSKILGFAILGLLIIGLFPYMALIGGLGILSAMGKIGTIDTGGLIVGGIFITIVCVLIPGLLTDPQTLEQKRATVFTEMLDVAVDTAENYISENPAVAFNLLGMDIQGNFIDNPQEILGYLKEVDRRAYSSALNMKDHGYTLLMPEPQNPNKPVVYYKPPERIRSTTHE